MKTKKDKALKTSLIIASLVVILSNTPPAQFFLLENYHYQNADNSFSFTEDPAKGLDFKVAQKRWARFQTANPDNHKKNKQTLYRTFTIKPYQFWQWWQYIAHPKRFTLPYTPPT